MTTWDKITDAQKEDAFRVWQSGNMSVEYARGLDMKKVTLERRLREYRREREYAMKNAGPLGFPDSASPVYDRYEKLYTDDFMVISDVEIPDHDPAMLNAVLLTAKRHNIKTLIIAGDYMATDMSSLNSWTETWAVGNEINYEGAIGLAVDILTSFAKWFDKIVIIEGNHDDRINRATGGEVWLGMLMKHVKERVKRHNRVFEEDETPCEIIFSRYSYMYVKTRNGWYYICHQKNFSKTPVRLAQQMWESVTAPTSSFGDLVPKAEKCHVIVTHCHLAQRGWSPDGQQECIALGTCRDPGRTRYKQQGATKHYEWIQGFGFVKRGFYHAANRRGTDWVMLLGELAKQCELLPPSALTPPDENDNENQGAA